MISATVMSSADHIRLMVMSLESISVVSFTERGHMSYSKGRSNLISSENI